MNKKILIIIRNFKKGGGAERTAANLGRKLYEIGYDVHYLSFLKTKISNQTRGKFFTLNQSLYDKSEYNGMKNYLKKVKKYINSKMRFIKYPKIIKNFSENYNIDLIISFGEYYNFCTLISKIIFRNKSKIIVSIRNNPELLYSKSRNILEFLVFKIVTIKYLYKKADMIVPISKGIEKKLLNYGHDKNKVKTIYNLYDINSYINLSKNKIPDHFINVFKNSFIFINIGRLAEQKGQRYLIKSFNKVVKKYPKAKLIIIGEGILEENLKNFVKKLSLENYVFFFGVQENIFPFIKNSNCFILSSLWEGFPNVLIEALSMNIPIISNDCKYGPRLILCPEIDISEEINYPYFGEYGILIKTPNFKNFNVHKITDEEKVLSDIMIKMIENNELQKKYTKGIYRALHFDESKIISEWENIFKKLA